MQNHRDDSDDGADRDSHPSRTSAASDPQRGESGPGSPAKDEHAKPAKADPKKHPEPRDPKVEKDQGFNESHGYRPGHGGPTSPGDAPAKAAPSTHRA